MKVWWRGHERTQIREIWPRFCAMKRRYAIAGMIHAFGFAALRTTEYHWRLFRLEK
jgi:hypothetical protein